MLSPQTNIRPFQPKIKVFYANLKKNKLDPSSRMIKFTSETSFKKDLNSQVLNEKFVIVHFPLKDLNDLPTDSSCFFVWLDLLRFFFYLNKGF